MVLGSVGQLLLEPPLRLLPWVYIAARWDPLLERDRQCKGFGNRLRSLCEHDDPVGMVLDLKCGHPECVICVIKSTIVYFEDHSFPAIDHLQGCDLTVSCVQHVAQRCSARWRIAVQEGGGCTRLDPDCLASRFRGRSLGMGYG